MKTYTATCDECGYTAGPSKTAKIAAHGLRIHSCDKHRAREASKARRLAREAAVDKTPKPCLHKRAQHQHGTHACYVLDRCRCDPCTAANTAYERQRARLHAYGRFEQKWVDAAPVRAHVQQLMRDGLGLKRIVALAGYSQGAMTKLIYGSEGREPTKRIRREHANAILAVEATIDTLAGGANIDGTGTRRRLHALMAIGWSQSKLARELGYTIRNFCTLLHGTRDVTAATHRKVAALYDRLWDKQPPRQTRGDKGAYTRSLAYARRHSWPPPLAWDDDTIDDPDATSDLGEQKRPGGKQIHVDDIEWVLDSEPFSTAQRIADRLHIGRDAVQATCRRAERQDLLDQLARNARLAKEGTTAA